MNDRFAHLVDFTKWIISLRKEFVDIFNNGCFKRPGVFDPVPKFEMINIQKYNN